MAISVRGSHSGMLSYRVCSTTYDEPDLRSAISNGLALPQFQILNPTFCMYKYRRPETSREDMGSQRFHSINKHLSQIHGV